MALKQNVSIDGKSYVQTENDIVYRGDEKFSFDAYVKVTSVSGNKTQITAFVAFTGDNANFEKRYVIPVTVVDGSKNFIKQAYEHLKTLPEFVGAIDC